MGTYYIQGNKTPVNLTQNEFISEGGEGKIFVVGKTSFKIYEDLKKMIPISKIQELMILDLKNIIRPKEIVLDKKNAVVGFTMDFVSNGVPLCKLFTNDFRNRNNVQPESITKLVEEMIKTIVFIHDKKCLQVDGNEMNYLVDDKEFTYPYFIDVNSYQTPSFPATAIMPNIRDWNSKTFSTLTDWYSFAIVSCQLFIGIHPFKGKHPKYKPSQLEDRMKNNISVFNKDVSVPSTCRDFSYIPTEFMEWYLKLFEKGERIPPPKVVGLLNVVQVQIKVIQTTDKFEITLISEFKEEIVRFKTYFNNSVVTTKSEVIINKTNYKVSKGVDVVFLPKSLEPIFVKIEDNKLIFHVLKTKETIETNIKCYEKLVINNTVYVRNEGSLNELTLMELGDKIVPAVKVAWNIMPKSSQLFGGMIYENALGKSFIVIPKPNPSGNSSCKIIRVDELDGYRIIDGKHDNNVVVLMGVKDASYKRFIIKINSNNSYNCRIDDVDDININFVTLDNGVVIMINSDDSLEMFHHDPKSTKVNVIKDPVINSSMSLYRDGVKVLFSVSNKLYQLKMK